MKQLIFIDNDHEERTNEDMRRVQRLLRRCGGLTDMYLETMQGVSNFSHMDEDAAYKLVFDPEHCIVTYSMYTASHYNSLGQMLHTFYTAAISEVKDMVYIDGSGQLMPTLTRHLSDYKHAYYVMNTIEMNNIISIDMNVDYDKMKFGRVRMDFKGAYNCPVKLEPINLKSILKSK